MMDTTTPRAGDWIQTYTGRAFYPMDVRSEDIDIVDIAHALSLECRYGGHSVRHYSVAQHSVLLHDNVPKEMRKYALLHDAAEAYIKDIPRPVKRLLGPAYAEMEARITAAIFYKFGVDAKSGEGFKTYDDRITVDEAHQVLQKAELCDSSWFTNKQPLGITIVTMSPTFAKNNFLARFYETFKEFAA